MENFCEQCIHEKFCYTQTEGDLECELYTNSQLYDITDDKYPIELIYDKYNKPTCTKFKIHNWRNDSGDLIEPKEVEILDLNQLSFFE